MQKKIPKIVRFHRGKIQNDNVFAAEELGRDAPDMIGLGVMVDDAGIALLQLDLDADVGFVRDASAGVPHQGAHGETRLVPERAHDAGDHGLVRDDISRRAGAEGADGDDAALARKPLREADQLLHENGAGFQRIDALFALGAVGGAAEETDLERVGRGIELAVADADRAGGKIRRDVVAEDGLDALHAAGGDHALGAALPFLVRLENKANRAAEIVAVAAEQHRRAEGGGDVHVVAAGVHDAGIFGREGRERRLLHGQGVHVRAQGDRRPGEASVERGDDAGIEHTAGPQTAGTQRLLNALRRFEFMVAELRRAVEGLAQLRELGFYFLDFGQIVR